MKTLIILCFALLMSGYSQAATSSVQQVHIALSPLYKEPDREFAQEFVLKAVSELPSGTRVKLQDAWNLRTIAVFEIPEVKFDRPGVRARLLRREISQILRWFDRAAKAGLGPEELRGTGALRIPEYLAFASQEAATEARTVLLIGSPLYQSLSEPSFSFGTDRFPSDANLFCEPRGSIFSVQGKRVRLKNTSVLFLYPGEGVFSSMLYKDRLERFWSLFCEYQGGVLASFHADPQRTVGLLSRPSLPSVRRDGVDPTQTKVEMRTISRCIPWVTITNEVGEVTFVFESPTAPEEPEQTVIRDLENVADKDTAVGIMWSVPAIDLDLYVFHHVGARPLFYNYTRTPEGRYLHDYRDRNDAIDYEKVILDSPTDLGQLRAFVNIYEGNSPDPIRGKVFLRHHGQTFQGQFKLASSTGNRGADFASRQSSPFWTELILTDLEEIGESSATNR